MTSRQHRNHDRHLGAMVQRYRTARTLTQRQLARAAGVSLGTVRDLEQGRLASPRWQTVENIAAVLGLDQRQRTTLLRARTVTAATAGGRPGPLAAAGAPFHISVLGPMSAQLGGVDLPLGSLRQRTVLGLLVLHAGTGVRRDSIVDTLWGASPPPSAVTQVHGYISRLRKLLAAGGDGGDGPVVTTAGAGYRLCAGGDQLDLVTFSRLLDDASRVGGDGPERARGICERALALWRGEVLSDIDLLRAHPVTQELNRRYCEAVIRHADLAVRTGVPDRALPHLRRLCARESFHEAAHAQLMVALVASGQRAAALDTFTAIRHRLTAELGISPGRHLQQAHAQVLAARLLPARWAAARELLAPRPAEMRHLLGSCQGPFSMVSCG